MVHFNCLTGLRLLRRLLSGKGNAVTVFLVLVSAAPLGNKAVEERSDATAKRQ